MKAYVLNGINQLVYSDVNSSNIPDGWVSVKVKAAGICSSDIPRIYTKGTYHFPTIPGHEFAGIVDAVGAGVDAKWVGKAVGVFPLIPCKKCESCQKGHYEMCSRYDYIGSRRDGAFAERVMVPQWNLLELDGSASYTEYAMLEPLSVALHAVKQAEFNETDSVVVLGTGMIGFAIALWSRKLGAKRVTVVGRNEQKRKFAEQYTGIEYVNASMQEIPIANVVFEAVGSVDNLKNAISTAASGGTIVLMGNPEGDMQLEQDIYWKILRKQLTLIGSWNSQYEQNERCDWTEARDAIQTGEIDVKKLVTHCYAQEKLADGLELMLTHKEPYCKVMTVWNEDEKNEKQ